MQGIATELIIAMRWGDLARVQQLVREALSDGVSATGNFGSHVLFYAVETGNLDIIHWLIAEGGADVTKTAGDGLTVLMHTITKSNFPGAQLLIEHGASMTAVTPSAKNAWDLLGQALVPHSRHGFIEFILKAREAIALLRAMLVRGDPPPYFQEQMLVIAPQMDLAKTVRDGSRLQARLPAYLIQRRGLLDANCPLLPPLQHLVSGCEEPTTTEELWATRLGEL
jgi:hypothetical protein